MLRHYLGRLFGWFGTVKTDGDDRQRAHHAHHDACEHGADAACPYERESFDCNDCELDEATGRMRPRS